MDSCSPTLNLGILAHVDAGKTSLTERLLYAAGVTDHVGRVDHGDIQTDTLALERQRGITIRSAVASFVVGQADDAVTVNLLDTPGHPDFIAEVERVLGVLDGAVLVVSAVEGVQAQTRVLMRTLRRLAIPTLVFVNKIDRGGADPAETLDALGRRLGLNAVALGRVTGAGTKEARVLPPDPDDQAHRTTLLDTLSTHDDSLVRRYLADPDLPYTVLHDALIGQTRRGLVQPVVFGSAMTGAGVDQIMAALTTYLPVGSGGDTGELSATVFKIERGTAAEKIAYVRVFDGRLRVRDRVPARVGAAGTGDKITALEIFDGGPAAPGESVGAGRIARVWGLASAQVGDSLGRPRRRLGDAFARPTLESLVRPVDPAAAGRLHTALTQLAEQDPLIGFRQHPSGALSVALYGEVQQEVIEATLASDYGVAVTFSETHVICVERVVGTGHAVEYIGDEANPYYATVGLRVEPGPSGSGAVFTQETVVHGTLPPAFVNAVAETVTDTLTQGVHGWEVVDVVVTLTHTGYYPRQSHSHAQFDKSMSSVGSDFRGLTPLVLLAALRRAGTQVCEPIARITLTVPTDTLSSVLPALARRGGVPDGPVTDGAVTVVTGTLAVARIQDFTAQLPGLSHGEGSLESSPDHDAPVRGLIPHRARIGPDPLDRRRYLLQVLR